MVETLGRIAAKWYSCPPLVHAMIVWLRLNAASRGMENKPVENKPVENKPVFNSDEQLLAVLARLDECRSVLAAIGNGDAAHLVSVAALDIRMKLNRVGDADLRLLCDAMLAKELAEDKPSPSQMSGQRPLLRVVK